MAFPSFTSDDVMEEIEIQNDGRPQDTQASSNQGAKPVPAPEPVIIGGQNAEPPVDLDSMTIAQLRAEADKRVPPVDLTGASTKAEILERFALANPS